MTYSNMLDLSTRININNFRHSIFGKWKGGICLTREQYKQMREAEVEGKMAEMDKKRGDPSLSKKEHDRFENEYQALAQQKADWERGGFWTANEDTAYKLNYERYHEVKGNYQRSSV